MNELCSKRKREDCWYNLNDATKKTYADFLKSGNLQNGICKLTIGTWPFNLLETWLVSFKREKLMKINHGGRNSISIDMGMLGQFSCTKNTLKHKMTIELKGRSIKFSFT